jgi:hypothetical protein
LQRRSKKDVDARDKAGHDEVEKRTAITPQLNQLQGFAKTIRKPGSA